MKKIQLSSVVQQICQFKDNIKVEKVSQNETWQAQQEGGCDLH